MVRLFFENTKLPGPVAAVRWCVDKIDLEFLKEKGITNPFLVLMVTRPRKNQDSDYDSDSESDQETIYEVVDHKVVPLDQAMEYLEFMGSGKHRVVGQLAWCRYSNREKVNQNRLSNFIRGYHDCRSSSASYIIERMTGHSFSSNQLESGYTDVVVPDGHFAKKPSAWETWWVNFWYESKPKNQCQFRKRRMVAYGVQPLVVIPYTLLRSFLLLCEVLWFLLVGVRQIKYSAPLHPFSYTLSDWEVVPDECTSWFSKDSLGNNRNDLFFMLIPLVQIFLLVVSGLLSIFVWGSVWAWFVGINLFVVLFILVVLSKILDGLLPKETDEEKVARVKNALELLYADYQDMICVGVPLKADISILPPKRRTFYLKFQDLKRRVCLPFAQ